MPDPVGASHFGNSNNCQFAPRALKRAGRHCDYFRSNDGALDGYFSEVLEVTKLVCPDDSCLRLMQRTSLCRPLQFKHGVRCGAYVGIWGIIPEEANAFRLVIVPCLSAYHHVVLARTVGHQRSIRHIQHAGRRFRENPCLPIAV